MKPGDLRFAHIDDECQGRHDLTTWPDSNFMCISGPIILLEKIPRAIFGKDSTFIPCDAWKVQTNVGLLYVTESELITRTTK